MSMLHYGIMTIAGLVVLLALFVVWTHTAPMKKRSADTLIVLGFQCEDDRIHPLLQERLDTALKLLRSHDFRKIILTGGAVASKTTEADIMKQYLLRNGVEESKILLDREARDTIENIRNCKAIMERYRLRTCLIVSNAFHMRRIRYIAGALGLASYYYADRSVRALARQMYWTLHEMRSFVITYRMIKGFKQTAERS